jgi:hypothetical protein
MGWCAATNFHFVVSAASVSFNQRTCSRKHVGAPSRSVAFVQPSCASCSMHSSLQSPYGALM